MTLRRSLVVLLAAATFLAGASELHSQVPVGAAYPEDPAYIRLPHAANAVPRAGLRKDEVIVIDIVIIVIITTSSRRA